MLILRLRNLGSTPDAVACRCVLTPWERHLILFPTLGPKQSTRCGGPAWRKTCKQSSFFVGVVWQTQSIVQHLAQTKKKKTYNCNSQLLEHKLKLHKTYLASWQSSIFDYKLRTDEEQLRMKILKMLRSISLNSESTVLVKKYISKAMTQR